MEPWGFEPQIPPCHGGVIPFHYGPGIQFCRRRPRGLTVINLSEGLDLSSIGGGTDRHLLKDSRAPQRPHIHAAADAAGPGNRTRRERTRRHDLTNSAR
jgi:hypothetical protein